MWAVMSSEREGLVIVPRTYRCSVGAACSRDGGLGRCMYVCVCRYVELESTVVFLASAHFGLEWAQAMRSGSK